MSWKPDRTRGFMVNAYYCLLAGSNDLCFPWKSIWKQKIPSQVAFFVWTTAWGKCLTIDNLRKMKVWILDWCYTCKCNGESIDYLFLHCPIVMDLRSMVLGLFGVSWVMPKLWGSQLVVWSSSEQSYMDNRSPLSHVVSLEGKKQQVL